jgi:uncharacterized protein (TIGR00730 family)
MSIKRLCVFCGSRPGGRPEYVAAARTLAKEMLERDIGLVYGGASVGVMGELADTMLAADGEVIGVIPRSLVEREIAHPDLSELKVVDSMHERKYLMAELADGFIALPGGLGTLDELFEALTWAQLGFHAKPCALVNTCGYYDHLSAFLDHATAEEFVKGNHGEMLYIEEQPARILELFAQHPVAEPR